MRPTSTPPVTTKPATQVTILKTDSSVKPSTESTLVTSPTNPPTNQPTLSTTTLDIKVRCPNEIGGLIMAGDRTPVMFSNGNIYKSNTLGFIELGPIKNGDAFAGLERVDALHRKIGEQNDISFFHGDL